MFQLCFNVNRIHDSVGKALRTANQGHVTVNSHVLSSIDILYTLDSASLLVKLKPKIFQRLPPFE
jgi:hypothetical protein